ncbi:hypothetical protein FBF83_00935 [Pseudalkalibacillus hwajinpoensis]|uniref:Uncharacterized protein n=1 Tax=Guptibacillus hwajinpoensis TaxID=208199 RepID=A0A4U1MKJ6_9BACL|nr:hypothetical protein FBF83_00935 [Pseudalkalibacillus hwajinpoensis]
MLFSKRLLLLKEVLYKEPHLANWIGRMLDSCGTSGTGETPQAQCFYAPRRLSARPAESEHPGAEIPLTLIATIFTKQPFIKKQQSFSKEPIKKTRSMNDLVFIFTTNL